MKNHPFRLLANLIAATAAMLYCSFAGASSQTGKIVYIVVRASDGLIYFELDGPRDAKPACATQGYFTIKSENSLAGRQQYALLVAAKVAAKSIFVGGAGQCTRWFDGEDVDAIRLAE